MSDPMELYSTIQFAWEVAEIMFQRLRKTNVLSLESEVTTLQTEVATLNTNKADKTALTALTTTVNSKASQTALDALTNTVNDKASQSALNNLTTTVSLKAQQSDVHILTKHVMDTLTPTVNNLTTTVNNIDGVADTSGLQSQIDTINTNVTNLNINKAEQAAFYQLSSQRATDRAAQATENVRLQKEIDDFESMTVSVFDTLNTSINGKASQAALNTLTTTVNGKVTQTDFTAHKDKIGDLTLLREPTLIMQLISDFNEIGNVINSNGYWVKSPEYNLSTHPDSNLAVRWRHMEDADPIAVHMFVRVIDPVVPTNQFVYPYTNFKVQPRFTETDTRPLARYLRLSAPGNDTLGFAVRYIRVTIRVFTGPPENSYFTEFAQPVISASAGIIMPQWLLVNDSAVAFQNSNTFSGLRFVELDLGKATRVQKIEVFGGIGWDYNSNAYVTFYDASKNIIFPEIGPKFITRAYGELNYSVTNDIEVSFDNNDVTKIININRAEASLFGTNRLLFFRALFSTSNPRQTKGIMETFTPVVDYL